jgi:hypothetical protein
VPGFTRTVNEAAMIIVVASLRWLPRTVQNDLLHSKMNKFTHRQGNL